ncbi:sensor histidine kinase [Brachybacterium sp. J153]|uniref:sensor histidine kinase n=1 Tax=Brachybacterium sp. J153 TaxID=3116488 RepID=UPI002E78A82E|nr:histidine kinase [Brachybacterium sp. J153]MEE1619239.1 histidine kinase [Brachybacterium sp. J153]
MALVPDRRALRRLGHDLDLVMTGLGLTLLAAIMLLPLGAVSAALAVVWVGVVLLPVTLGLAAMIAGWDRARLVRWGIRVAPPDYRPRGSGVRGLLPLLGDPRRWLDLAFEALIALPVRAATAGAAVAWAGAALGGLTFWAWGRALPAAPLPLGGQWAVALALGIVLALSFPAVVHQLARLDVLVTVPLLGGEEPGSRPAPGPRSAAPGPATVLHEEAWTRMTVAFLGVVLLAVGWPVTAALYDVHPALAMLVAVAASAAPLVAVGRPREGLALSVLVAAGTMLVTAPAQALEPWPWAVTALIAHCLVLAVLAVLHRWYWSLAGWSAGAVLTLLALVGTLPVELPGPVLRQVSTNAVVQVAISGAVVLLGLTVRQLVLVSERVEEAQTVTAEEMRRRIELEERHRIARELHDVVAHSMSVITVQAGTARFRLGGLDARTEQEFEDIAASSRQALAEMRALLATLRTDEGPEDLPQPGLADLPELIDASRATGARIDAELDPVEVPPTVGLTAFRVVQEALSNALRHARGAPITVRVTAGDGALAVHVGNDAPRADHAPIPGSGLGLDGARQRVAALGGTFAAGPREDGGFTVRALIPIADPLPR